MLRIAGWPSSPEAMHARVLTLVKSAHAQGCVASLRLVVVKEEFCWPLFGRIDLVKPADVEPGPRFKYEKIRTLAEQITADQLHERLMVAFSGGAFPCDGEELTHHLLSQHWYGSRHHAYEYGPWPCTLVQVQASARTLASMSLPLVSADAPLFSDSYDLRRKVAHFRVDNPTMDSRLHNIVLVAWDYRGRIVSIEHVPPVLSLRLAGTDLQSMVLTGRIETPDSEVVVHRPATELIHVTLDSEPKRLELALVAGYELVDLVKEGPYSRAHASRLVVKRAALENDDARMAEVLLRDGESDGVEFKPWLNLATGDKRNELLETAIAFANGRGGSIVVGVDRYGQPLGEDKHLKAWKGEYLKHIVAAGGDRREPASEELLRIYGAQLREFIQSHTNRRIEMRLITQSVAGRDLLLCEIKSGQEKPVATQPGNDIWVRVNATNRRPSLEELKELLIPGDVDALEDDLTP